MIIGGDPIDEGYFMFEGVMYLSGFEGQIDTLEEQSREEIDSYLEVEKDIRFSDKM